MANIISIMNQKGGVGKTTIAVNLSACLSAAGYKTLIIDSDPQANAGLSYGISDITEDTLYDVLINNLDIKKSIRQTSFNNLDIIPSNDNLYSLDFSLKADDDNDKIILKNILTKIENDYDFIIIDTPPNLGMISVNIMVATHKIIVPIKADYLSLKGLNNLLKNYRRVKEVFNKKLYILGVIITMFNQSTILSRDIENTLYRSVGELLFTTKIPQNVKIAASPSYGQPIINLDNKGAGSIAFYNFTNEVINRINIKQQTN
jgi:chromosome partitioning protein